MATGSPVAALVAGAALGWASAEVTRRLGGRRTVVAAGVSLVTAAVIYPAARREHDASAAHLVEGAVVGATAALALLAAGGEEARGRRLVAAGWAAHALFDFGQGPSRDSRLPAWYAPLCAGYDLTYAGRLAR